MASQLELPLERRLPGKCLLSWDVVWAVLLEAIGKMVTNQGFETAHAGVKAYELSGLGHVSSPLCVQVSPTITWG